MTSQDPSSNRAPTPGKSRPSLTVSQGVQEDRLSILASLETRERDLFARPASSGKWRWAIGLFMLVVVAAAYVYVRADDVFAPRVDPLKLAVSTPSVTNSSVPLKSAIAADAASAVVADSASAPARIEVVEPTAPRASEAGGTDPFAALAASSGASAAGVSTAASAPLAASAPAAMAVANALPASAAATHKPSTHVAAKAAKHPPKPEAKGHALASAAHKPASRDAVKTVKDSGGRDPDVDLLAALMAHVANTGDGKGGRSHDRSRIPVDEPSIAKLVKRCEGLNGDEAAQCQKRICDGYWGKAQACPARSETAHRE